MDCPWAVRVTPPTSPLGPHATHLNAAIPPPSSTHTLSHTCPLVGVGVWLSFVHVWSGPVCRVVRGAWCVAVLFVGILVHAFLCVRVCVSLFLVAGCV